MGDRVSGAALATLVALIALASSPAGTASAGAGSATAPTQPVIASGVRLVYSIDRDPERAAAVLARRFAGFGGEATARAEHGKVVVDVASTDLELIARLKELVRRPGRFEIRAVVEGAHGAPSKAMAALVAHVRADPDATRAGVAVEHDSIVADDDEGMRRTGHDALADYLRNLPRDLALPRGEELAYEPTFLVDDGTATIQWRAVDVADRAMLDNRAIAGVRDASVDPPSVTIALTPEAARAVRTYSVAHVHGHLAVIVDGVAAVLWIGEPLSEVTLEVPVHEEAANPNDVGFALASGPLPGPLVLESEDLLRNP